MVKPEDIPLSQNKEYDEFPILSIPGYNTGLFYNSFRRFFSISFSSLNISLLILQIVLISDEKMNP